MKKTLCSIISSLVLTTPLFSYNAALAKGRELTYQDFSYQQCAALSDQSAQKTKEDILRQAAETLRPYVDLHREFIALFRSLDQPRDDANRFQLMACTVSPKDTPTNQHRVTFLFQNMDDDPAFNPDNDVVYHIPENKFLGLKNSPFLDVPVQRAPPLPQPPEESAPPAPTEESAPPAPSGEPVDSYQLLIRSDDPGLASSVLDNTSSMIKERPEIAACVLKEAAEGLRRTVNPMGIHMFQEYFGTLDNPILHHRFTSALVELDGEKAFLFEDENKNRKFDLRERLLNIIHEDGTFSPYSEKCAVVIQKKVGQNVETRRHVEQSVIENLEGEALNKESRFSARVSLEGYEDALYRVQLKLGLIVHSSKNFYVDFGANLSFEQYSSANDVILTKVNMPLFFEANDLVVLEGGPSLTLGFPFSARRLLLYGRGTGDINHYSTEDEGAGNSVDLNSVVGSIGGGMLLTLFDRSVTLELAYARQLGQWEETVIRGSTINEIDLRQSDGIQGHKLGAAASWHNDSLIARLAAYAEGSNIQPVCSVLSCAGAFGKTGALLSLGLLPADGIFLYAKMESGGISPFAEYHNQFIVGFGADIGLAITNEFGSHKLDRWYHFTPEFL